LSDKPETTFDHNKVGKVSDGRYIIIANKDSDIFVREIIKISNTEFEYTIITPNKQTRSSENQMKFAYRVKPNKK